MFKHYFLNLKKERADTLCYNLGAVPNNIVDIYLHNLNLKDVLTELDDKIKTNKYNNYLNDLEYAFIIARSCNVDKTDNEVFFDLENYAGNLDDINYLEEMYDKLYMRIIKDQLKKEHKTDLLFRLNNLETEINELFNN